MSEHPTPSELRQWFWGGLAGERSKEVSRHLLRGCAHCRGELSAHVCFAAGTGPVPEDVDRAYDAALDRAPAKARRLIRLSREKQELLPFLLAAKRRGAQTSEPVVHPVAQVEALLEAAWQLRFQNPIRMGHLAERAKNLAERLTGRQAGGRRALADLRCRCWLILANALRVRDELSDAHPALKRAFSYFEEGTRSGDLEIQLHEILAALCADERDFVSAEEAAHAAYRIARDERDFHRAGKALIQAGTYFGWAGRPQEAVRYLEHARRLIDKERDPSLEDVALQNMADFLVDCQEYKRAQRLVFDLHRRFARGGKELLRLKLRGIQAKIYFGLGDIKRAEREYLALREGLQKARRPYPAALADLEIALVYLVQVERSLLAGEPYTERQPIVRKFLDTVHSALTVFKRLHIDREALGAVILLEKSALAGNLSRTDLEKIIEALRTADRSPRRKLPDEAV